MTIHLTYGTAQRFRYRHADINLLGRVADAAYPLRKAVYRLNDGPEVGFYVEAVPDPGIDWTTEYKDSPAVNRLKDQGDFNIEIPVTAPQLRTGANRVRIEVADADNAGHACELEFGWSPTPIALPYGFTDLSWYRHVQEFAQVVNGAFDLDPERNVIRSRDPAYIDSLLLLGSPSRSQEATYRVRFTGFAGAKWLGPSDFFVGHEEAEPPLGVKPGWSSAGLVALSPKQEARAFLAWGDHCGTGREWVVKTEPPVPVALEETVDYRVRHQVSFRGAVNRVRFRIWPEGTDEPEDWLLEADDTRIKAPLIKHKRASFGLFQHSGPSIEWSDIWVRAL